MKAKGCKVELGNNKPGFTLPSNIGELGDDITELDLSMCSLHGAFVVRGMTRHTLTKMKLSMAIACTGSLPKELGNLTNLKNLSLHGNDALEKPVGCPLDGHGDMLYRSKDEVAAFLRCFV